MVHAARMAILLLRDGAEGTKWAETHPANPSVRGTPRINIHINIHVQHRGLVSTS